MSFTEDELESFNTILEQRLLAQRQEFEMILDRRLEALQSSFHARIIAFQQEFINDASSKLANLQAALNSDLEVSLNALHARTSQSVEDLVEKCLHTQEQHFENLVSRTNVLQLQGVEQLLQEYSPPRISMSTTLDNQDQPSHYDSIEVQTELPLEALIEAFNRSLNERFASLQNVTQGVFKQWEEFLHTRLQTLSAQLFENMAQMQHRTASPLQLESHPDLQSVLQGIDQLERVIESMQVAMTANQALLSNRIHHHQQLPLERAHTPGAIQSTSQEMHIPLSPDINSSDHFPNSGVEKEEMHS